MSFKIQILLPFWNAEVLPPDLYRHHDPVASASATQIL